MDARAFRSLFWVMVEVVADQVVAPDSATKIGLAQSTEDCLGASRTLSVVNLDNQYLDLR